MFKFVNGGVRNKVVKLLQPQLLLAVIMIIKILVFDSLQGRQIGLTRLVDCLYMWFLPVLFLCSVLYLLIGTLFDTNKILVKMISLLLSVITSFFFADFSESVDSKLCMIFLILPMAFNFFLLGNLAKSFIATIHENRNMRNGILALMAILLCYILGSINSPVKMYENQYGHLFLFFCSAILGIFSILYLCMFIKESNFLMFVGRNSIAFYVWQFSVTSILVSMFNRLLPRLLNIPDNNVTAFAAFACSIPILSCIVSITQRYVPSIYGLNRQR